jgi:hypothetical protein
MMKTTAAMLGAVALASCLAAASPASGAGTLGTSGEFLAYCHGERWQRLACMSYAKAVADSVLSLVLTVPESDTGGIRAPKNPKLGPDQIIDPPIPARKTKPIRAVRP